MKRCSFESGIMVLALEPDPREGAPLGRYRLSTPIPSQSPSTITARWPMPGCCFPPLRRGISARRNWWSNPWACAAPRAGQTPATSSWPWQPPPPLSRGQALAIFPRSIRWGHVRPLDRVRRELLARPLDCPSLRMSDGSGPCVSPLFTLITACSHPSSNSY